MNALPVQLTAIVDNRALKCSVKIYACLVVRGADVLRDQVAYGIWNMDAMDIRTAGIPGYFIHAGSEKMDAVDIWIAGIVGKNIVMGVIEPDAIFVPMESIVDNNVVIGIIEINPAVFVIREFIVQDCRKMRMR